MVFYSPRCTSWMGGTFRNWGSVLLSVIALTSCVGEPISGGGSHSVRDSVGVRIIENRGPDQLVPPPVWTADLLPPDSSLTAVPWGISADPMAGQVYVADWTGTRVSVFDRRGRFVKDLGRSGDGPGEFRNPTALSVDPFGALVVFDAGRGVVSRWSSRGDLLNEERAPAGYWGPGFVVGRDRQWLVAADDFDGGLGTNQRLVEIRGGTEKTLHEVQMESAVAHLPCGTFPAPRVFSPSILWTHQGDTLWVVHGRGYRIDGIVDGTAVASFRRDIEPIPATQALAIKAVESGIGPYNRFLDRCGATAKQLVTEISFEESVSSISGVLAAPNGDLWVSRSPDGITPSLVDILGPDGVYRGTAELSGVPAGFLSDSLFVVLRIQDTGEVRVSLMGFGSTVESTSDLAPQEKEVEEGVFREFRDCARCPLMVEMPSGSFLMGSPPGEVPASANPNRPDWTERAERPQVRVEFRDRFALGKYEVTFDEWDECVRRGGCEYRPPDDGWGRGDRPVIHVSRADADEYTTWLSELTGGDYRLPSEAEWEYAARAGTTTARYWGDSLGHGLAVCDGCGSRWDLKSTAPVGSFQPNPWGLHDMLGNVSEWVADCWIEDHSEAPPDGRARISESPWWNNGRCERPAKRGGTFSSYPWTVRAAYRNYFLPGPWTDRDSQTQGFRVAKVLSDQVGR